MPPLRTRSQGLTIQRLRSSEYGEGYVSESPVKLLDQLMHGFKKLDDEEVVVLSQVPGAPR